MRMRGWTGDAVENQRAMKALKAFGCTSDDSAAREQNQARARLPIIAAASEGVRTLRVAERSLQPAQQQRHLLFLLYTRVHTVGYPLAAAVTAL